MSNTCLLSRWICCHHRYELIIADYCWTPWHKLYQFSRGNWQHAERPPSCSEEACRYAWFSMWILHSWHRYVSICILTGTSECDPSWGRHYEIILCLLLIIVPNRSKSHWMGIFVDVLGTVLLLMPQFLCPNASHNAVAAVLTRRSVHAIQIHCLPPSPSDTPKIKYAINQNWPSIHFQVHSKSWPILDIPRCGNRYYWAL